MTDKKLKYIFQDQLPKNNQIQQHNQLNIQVLPNSIKNLCLIVQKVMCTQQQLSKSEVQSKINKSTVNKRINITNEKLFPKSYPNDLSIYGFQQLQQSQDQLKLIQGNNIHIFITTAFVNCNFPNLIFLRLDCLNINNLQFLSFLNASQLKYLQLVKNNISNFNSLIKTNLNNLTLINIKNNPAPIINIQRMNLSKNINKFSLQQFSNETVMIQDLSNLVKLQSKMINLLHVQSQERIKQSKSIQKIFKRYYQKDQVNKVKYVMVIQCIESIFD